MNLKLRGLSFALTMAMASTGVQAQKAVSGVVVDDTGEPLIGVTVSAGNNQGAVTDMDGKFTLPNVSTNTILNFSYVGFKQQQVRVGNSSNLTIQLAPTDESLNEVVVIGYGVVKKRDLVGSISTLKQKDIVAVPTTNVLESLQGKVAGLDMTRSSGAVGAGMSFTVRGNRSLTASNAPLSSSTELPTDLISASTLTT